VVCDGRDRRDDRPPWNAAQTMGLGPRLAARVRPVFLSNPRQALLLRVDFRQGEGPANQPFCITGPGDALLRMVRAGQEDRRLFRRPLSAVTVGFGHLQPDGRIDRPVRTSSSFISGVDQFHLRPTRQWPFSPSPSSAP